MATSSSFTESLHGVVLPCFGICGDVWISALGSIGGAVGQEAEGLSCSPGWMVPANSRGW